MGQDGHDELDKGKLLVELAIENFSAKRPEDAVAGVERKKVKKIRSRPPDGRKSWH